MIGDGLMDPHGTTVIGNQEIQTISTMIRIMLGLVWKMLCGMIWRLLKEHIFVNVMPSNKNLTNTLYELKLVHICKQELHLYFGTADIYQIEMFYLKSTINFGKPFHIGNPV